ncbi:MAG TPA: glutaredoxin family protein [Bryobacteraceae bacterium]|nr:glutaredoxin family protein [Bryobacteraceae bacterium]
MEQIPNVTLYTRKGCCLCEEAKQVLDAVRNRASFELHQVDIDGDPALQRMYNDEVPVIAINGAKAFKYRVTADELLRKLAARR